MTSSPDLRGVAVHHVLLVLAVTDDGHIDGVVGAVRMGVAAHDGHAELAHGGLHPPHDLSADLVVLHGKYVDHADGHPAHGGDVVYINKN